MSGARVDGDAVVGVTATSERTAMRAQLTDGAVLPDGRAIVVGWGGAIIVAENVFRSVKPVLERITR